MLETIVNHPAPGVNFPAVLCIREKWAKTFDIAFCGNYHIIMKKIITAMLCLGLVLTLCSCASYQDAPSAVFTEDTVSVEAAGISFDYPAGWNELGDTDPGADYNDPIFEATSPLQEGLTCSSVILVKASSTEEKKLDKVVRADDAGEIINKLSQGLGTTLTLRNADMYMASGRQIMWFEASFVRDEKNYVLSQTYFIHEGDVYILTVVAAQGCDDENALQIPFSLHFDEE